MFTYCHFSTWLFSLSDLQKFVENSFFSTANVKRLAKLFSEIKKTIFFETKLWSKSIYSIRIFRYWKKNQSAHYHSFDDAQVLSILNLPPSLVLCDFLVRLGTTNKSILSFFFTWYICKCHIFREYTHSHTKEGTVFYSSLRIFNFKVTESWSSYRDLCKWK